jgi:hypothetical protein
MCLLSRITLTVIAQLNMGIESLIRGSGREVISGLKKAQGVMIPSGE